MSSYKCIIIEDDEIDRLLITSVIKKHPQLDILGIYENAEDAASDMTYKTADVLFLDIDMEGMNGLEFRKIAEGVPACIFITSHPEYAIESFDVDTLDFIVKPVYAERFEQMMNRLNTFFDIRTKAHKYENYTQDQYVYIKEGHNESKVHLDDIYYLEALKDYTLIITKEKRHCVLSSLGNLLCNESFSSFIRVHKSFAVLKNKIQSVGSKEVILVNGIAIPVGRKYKDGINI